MELQLVNSVDADNPDENDLYLDSTGNLVFVEDRAIETAQRIRVRLRFFKGEWFLDQNQGTPWFQEIFVKNPSPEVVRAIFKDIIETAPGVLSVDAIDFALDAALRILTLTFTAKLEDQSLLRSTDFAPFVVEI